MEEACSGGQQRMGGEWPQMMTGESLLSGGGGGSRSSCASLGVGMERRHQQQPGNSMAAALNCPRCDSSNTKFCYYNNYSLSQPRHFCKACKRYWTRGGTLRNVPVGGGCRKNKRVKKPSSSSSSSSLSATAAVAASLAPPPPPLPMPNGTDFNPLVYDGNLSFLPTLLQPTQLDGPDLGYPQNSSSNHEHSEYQSGFGGSNNNIPHHLHQSSVLHDYPLLGSSLSTATAASLLLSSLKQPSKIADYHQAFLPYEYGILQNPETGNPGFPSLKEVKMEADVWRVSGDNPFEIEPVVTTAADSTSSSLYWNSSISAWPDAANYGSSVAPLI